MGNFRTAKYDSTQASLAIDDPNKNADFNTKEVVSLQGANGPLTLQEVPRALKKLGNPEAMLPFPARTIPFRNNGFVRYIDPTWVGTQAGTFAQPFSSFANALTAANDTVANQSWLLKAGTTLTATGRLTFASSGTQAQPIVVGVYNPFNGERLLNSQGAATINFNGGNYQGILITAASWICVDGLHLTNNSGTNELLYSEGAANNIQVLNVRCSGGARGHIRIIAPTSTIVVENCLSENAAANAIEVLVSVAGNLTAKVNYNKVTNCGGRGIFVFNNFENLIGASPEIAVNTVADCVSEGILVLAAGGAPKIYRNSVKRAQAGASILSAVAFQTVTADFSGALIENNKIANCEFNVAVSLATGLWTVQYNDLRDAGSRTGAVPFLPNAFGRAIEIFGPTPATGSADGVIRYNYCVGSYNWQQTLTPGSEGVGIGIDDNTRNVSVYGNFCAENEGKGIQINRGTGNLIFSNIVYDNAKPRPGRNLVWERDFKCQIGFVLSPGIQIFNNTVISTGQPEQLYGISEMSTGVPSPGGRIFNNLIVGQLISGFNSDTTTVTATESNNAVFGGQFASTSSFSDLPIPQGPGGLFLREETSGAFFSRADLFFALTPTSALLSAGTSAPSGPSFTGELLPIPSPIGATLPLDY